MAEWNPAGQRMWRGLSIDPDLTDDEVVALLGKGTGGWWTNYQDSAESYGNTVLEAVHPGQEHVVDEHGGEAGGQEFMFGPGTGLQVVRVRRQRQNRDLRWEPRTLHADRAGRKWYHVSPHRLAPGTVLTPGGGESPWGDEFYQAYPERAEHVWMEPEERKSHWLDPYSAPYWYEVAPEGEPANRRDWEDMDLGWVAPSATVVADVTPDWSDEAVRRSLGWTNVKPEVVERLTRELRQKQAAGDGEWALPRAGEGFDGWRARLWDGLSAGGRAFAPNATGSHYRAVSDEEYRAALEAGGFKPLLGGHLFVTDDPDRLAGGAYGARGGGHIVEFAPQPTEKVPSTYGGFDELAVAGIPLSAVRRVWSWDGKDHVPAGAARTAADDYKRRHRPPGPHYGFPLHAMDVPEDFYDHPEWYGGDHQDSAGDVRAVQDLYRRSRGNPDLPVTVYRAMPVGHDELNEGDWVTLSPGYARGHIESQANPEDFHVVSRSVPAREVWSDGGDWNELGYWPAGRQAARRDPHLGEGPWYHASGEVFEPGRVLLPGDAVGSKAQGRWSDGSKVWVSNDPVRASAYGFHLYEVEPAGRPRSPHGNDEHHTSGATVLREVPEEQVNAWRRTYDPSKGWQRQSKVLYRGLEREFDPHWDRTLSEPAGYSHWTDNPDLAKAYAGPRGRVYQIDLPDEAMGDSYIDDDGERPLYYDNDGNAALGGVKGREYLLYEDHEGYDPARVRPFLGGRRTAMPAALPEGVLTYRLHAPGERLPDDWPYRYPGPPGKTLVAPLVSAYAHGDPRPVGFLEWFGSQEWADKWGRGNPDEVSMVHVDEGWRHHGIATGMFDHARANAAPGLAHSDAHTDAGRGWAEYEESRRASRRTGAPWHAQEGDPTWRIPTGDLRRHRQFDPAITTPEDMHDSLWTEAWGEPAGPYRNWGSGGFDEPGDEGSSEEDLVEAFEKGDRLPPVEVVTDGTGAVLSDGNHRVEVADMLSRPDLESYIWFDPQGETDNYPDRLDPQSELGRRVDEVVQGHPFKPVEDWSAAPRYVWRKNPGTSRWERGRNGDGSPHIVDDEDYLAQVRALPDWPAGTFDAGVGNYYDADFGQGMRPYHQRELFARRQAGFYADERDREWEERERAKADAGWTYDFDAPRDVEFKPGDWSREPVEAPAGPWYHVSLEDLKPGTVLRPGGGDSQWGGRFQTGPYEARGKWVWFDTPERAEWWDETGEGSVYEVRPRGGAAPWNNTGADGWVAPAATVVRKVRGPRYPRTAAAAGPSLTDLYGDFKGWWEGQGDHDVPGIDDWAQITRYLSERQGLEYGTPEFFASPVALQMAKLHALASDRDTYQDLQLWGQRPIPDSDRLEAAGLGLLRLRQRQAGKDADWLSTLPPAEENLSAACYADWCLDMGKDPFDLDNAAHYCSGYGEASDARGIYEWIRGHLPQRRASRRLAVFDEELVGRLQGEFDNWWKTQGVSGYRESTGHKWEDSMERGPIGHWPNIEQFMSSRYPAAFRGLSNGYEEAAPLLDLKGSYQTGPEAVAQYGYDPAEIAAGMLLLHNRSAVDRAKRNGGGYFDPSPADQARLNDIAQKRHEMQERFDRQWVTASRRLAALADEFVAGLQHEFDGWAAGGGAVPNPYAEKYPVEGQRGPIGYWPNVEGFLRERYPAAHKGFDLGLEGAAPALRGLRPGRGYEGGPEAEAKYGYDPSLVAAGMMLLHTRSHPGRRGTDLEARDEGLLLDLFRKRQEMQRRSEGAR